MSPRVSKSREVARVPRRRILGGAFAAGLTAALGKEADAGEGFFVVVHPDNPNVASTRAFLALAFLKKTSRWENGEAIHPVDLGASSPVRRAFSEHVLGRSVAAVRTYWQQRIFSGRGVPPPELASDEAVLAFVRGHRGAVGYVSSGAELRGVKALQVK